MTCVHFKNWGTEPFFQLLCSRFRFFYILFEHMSLNSLVCWLNLTSIYFLLLRSCFLLVNCSPFSKTTSYWCKKCFAWAKKSNTPNWEFRWTCVCVFLSFSSNYDAFFSMQNTKNNEQNFYRFPFSGKFQKKLKKIYQLEWLVCIKNSYQTC